MPWSGEPFVLSPELVGCEVSSLLVRSTVQAYGAAEIPTELWFGGYGIQRASLGDPAAFVSWDTFLALLDLGADRKGLDWVQRLGAGITRQRPMRAFHGAMRAVFDPRPAPRDGATPEYAVKSGIFLRCMQIQVHAVADDALHVAVVFADGYTPTEAVLRFITGGLLDSPAPFPRPVARIERAVIPRGVRFEVHLKRGRRLRNPLGRLLPTTGGGGPSERELHDAYATLSARYTELHRACEARDAAQAAHAAIEARYRMLVEHAPFDIHLLDGDGRLWDPDVVAVEVDDTDERPHITELVAESDRARVSRALSEVLATSEHRALDLATRDGRTLHMRLTAMPEAAGPTARVTVICEDVTERRALHARLERASRLESLGQLAGGIVHDFNNLLTGIHGYAALGARDNAGKAPLEEYFAEILSGTGRAVALVRQLLTFARRGDAAGPKAIDLNRLVVDAQALLAPLLPKTIDLDVVLGDDLPMVWVDSGLFEQVLVTLAINARDAMPNGGRLTLGTRAVSGDEALQVSPGGGAVGGCVELFVAGTGTGPAPETVAQMFEPPLTTTDDAKGSGLALASVRETVQRADGHIVVDTAAGSGTTVRVRLPTWGAVANPTHNAARPTRLIGGSETILVVEDDPLACRLVVEVLSQLGYRVVTAHTGADGFRRARELGDRLDLLVTDVDLPGLSGPELAATLRAVRPTLRVLFISAHDGAADHHLADGQDLEPLLAKPFEPEALAQLVRALLAPPAA